MAEPALVGDCVAAMKAAVAMPVTVKCRIGIDEQDPEEALEALTACREAGRRRRADRACAQGLARRVCRRARTATSRRSTTTRVYRLKAAHPRSPDRAQWRHRRARAGARRISTHVDGVMMGRAAYQEPWRLLAVDPLLFGEPAPLCIAEGSGRGADPLSSSANSRAARGCTPSRATCSACSAACPGARAFRRHLATEAVKPGAMLAPSAMRSLWLWTRMREWRTPPPLDLEHPESGLPVFAENATTQRI